LVLARKRTRRGSDRKQHELSGAVVFSHIKFLFFVKLLFQPQLHRLDRTPQHKNWLLMMLVGHHHRVARAP